MARTPVRGEQWSLRQARLAAGMTDAAARAVQRSGVLGDLEAPLSTADVLALKVAAALAPLTFPGESRPANSIRVAAERERQAVEIARQVHADTGQMLLVFSDRVQLTATAAELAGAVLSCTGEPYLVLPLGSWWSQLHHASEAAS